MFCTLAKAQQIVPYNTYATDQYKFSNENLSPKYYKDIANRLNVFVGDWKYVNGNQTFIITIRKELKVPTEVKDEVKFYSDDLYAHYKLVQDFGLPTQQTIYTSQKRIRNNHPKEFETILYGWSYQNNVMSGTVCDVTGPEPIIEYWEGVPANFVMEVSPYTTPITATWKVTRKPGMVFSDQPKLITIPMDVVLTKM